MEAGGVAPPRMRTALAMLAPRSGQLRFLDIGAGYGDDVRVAQSAGCSILALEPEPHSAAVFTERTGLTARAELFETIALPADGFDLIMANQVLEHVQDPDVWLAKLARVLAPEGIACIALPNFDNFFRFVMGVRDPFITPPYHLNFFNRRTLQRLARRHGLALIQADWHTHIAHDTIVRRVAVPLRPFATAGARPFGWVVDRLGLGISLTLYFRAQRP